MATNASFLTRVVPVAAISVLLIVYSVVQYQIGLGPELTLYWSDGFWTVFALGAAWRCFKTARQCTNPAYTRAWTYFAAASLSWAAGIIVWDYYELVRGIATPFPSFADFGFQGLAVLFVIGSLYYRGGAPSHQITVKNGLNIGIALVAVMIVSILALHRSLHETTESFAYIAIAVAYPVVYGTALLFAMSWLWMAVERGRRAYALMVCGLMFHTGVNIAYAASLLVHDYQTGLPLDVFWLIGFGFFYLGATEADLSPATPLKDAENSTPVEAADNFVQPSEAILPGLAILAVLGTAFFYRDAFTNPSMTANLFAMAVVLIILLVGREWWVFLYHRRAQQLLIYNVIERKQAEHSLKESEARLRDFGASAADWYWEMDKTLRFSYFSDRFTDVTGVPPEALLGKTRQENGNPGASREAWQEHLGKLAHHRPFRNFVHPRTLPDGRVVWLSINGKPVFDTTGRFKGYRGTGADVTPLHEMQEELVQAKDDAEDANKAKSEFLASMSHELRTPLNAVLGFAQMLQLNPKAPLSPMQNGQVESIMTGGNHLLELINEILDLAKIEADQLDLTLEDVSANDVVAETVSLMAPLGEDRKITIIDQCDSGSSVLLRTDRQRFKQILINLLSNALKYNKDGGAVTVDAVKIADDFLRISVTDTGTGIAKKDQAKVFHMFHRLGADPLIAQEGTGIGLTVTKLLVERMAGRIGFDSEKGLGSTFWIELPLTTNETALIWTDALRIGVDAIDKDHQVIVELLNKVSVSQDEGTGLGSVINELVDYTLFHFRREEMVMKICGYPDFEQHLALHQELRDQVNALADAWTVNRDVETLENLKTFLRNWLFDHILKADSTIAPYTHGNERRIDAALIDVE